MKLHKTILLFSGVELLIAGIEIQKIQETLKPHTWILRDGWPLDKEENDRLMILFKKRHEDAVTVIDGGCNRGIHEGFNYLTSLMPLEDDDLILTVAPDTVPLQKGYDEAMVSVLEYDDSLAYIGTNSYAIDATPGNWVNYSAVGRSFGIRYKVSDSPAMSHATMWRWSFLKKVGGFSQPTKYYGHLEAEMWSKARALQMRNAYLCDYGEDFRLEGYHNDTYRRWKLAQAHSFTFKGSFEEYLAAGYK